MYFQNFINKGIKQADIARELPEAIIALIKKNKAKIIEYSQYINMSICQRISHSQYGAIHITETLLYTWILDQLKYRYSTGFKTNTVSKLWAYMKM